MKPDRFKELLDELDDNSLQIMKDRNAKYAKAGDCLHNFRKGAAINRNTLAQTCWGYMSKHLVALQDKVESDDFSDREDFLEKCQDTINYIRFLWCIGNEGVSNSVSDKSEDEDLHERHILFSDIDVAQKFMENMENLLSTNRVITKVDVCKYTTSWYDINAYTMGWTSTNGWMIKENCLSGEVEVILPPPINIWNK